jgi:hypothetical protein
MKKLEKFTKHISQFFIIVGIPILFVYGYQIHNEQIRMKDQKIETLESFNETLKYNQINSVMERFNSLKELHENVYNDFNLVKKNNDSLNKIIEDLVAKFENKKVCLDRETAIIIAQKLLLADIDKKEIEILEKIIINQEIEIISLQKK